MPSPATAAMRKRFFLVIGLTVLAVGLSVLSITPKLVPWRDNPLVFETTKVSSMIEQLDNPGGWERAHLSDPEFNGIQTIRWRLFPPMLGGLLHCSPHVYLTLPWVALVVLVGLVVHYALGRGASALEAFALAVLTGTSSAFFSGACAIGYFDPFYLIALLVACYSPSNLLFLAACIFGPWIDEKFLLMLPTCCFLRWTWKPELRWVRFAAYAIVPYCLIRTTALALGDSSVSRQISMQSPYFLEYARALPAAWWYGFRVGWIVVLAGFWLLGKALEPRLRWLMTGFLLACIGMVSFLAWDSTRSIAMLLPLLLLGVDVKPIRRILPLLALINLLLPAAYVWCAKPVTVPMHSIFARW